MRLAHLELAGGVALATAVATALTAPTGDAQSAPDVGPHAAAVEYRVVLTSNRDGEDRGYSVRPDGSA
jgi:hypothetical protein